MTGTHNPNRNFSSASLFRVAMVAVCLGCAALCGAQTPPATVEQLWREAAEAQQAKDYLRAASLYRKVLELQPGMKEAEVNLCLTLHLGGSVQDAVNCFDRVAVKYPDLFPVNFLGGMDNLKLGRPERALIFLKKAVEESPDRMEPRLGLANAELQVGRYSEARDDFMRAAQMNAQEADAWYGLGATYLSMEKELETELRRSSSPYRAVLLAESYVQQGRTEKAVASLSNVVAGDPKVPCAATMLGFAYLAQSKLDEATEQFGHDWDSASGEGCLLAKLGMAGVAAKRGNAKEALARLREAAAVDADAVMANRDLFWSSLAGTGIEEQARAILDGGKAQNAAGNLAGSAAGAASSMKHGRYSACSSSLAARGAGLDVPQLRLLSLCSYYAGHDDRTMTATRQILKAIPGDAEALYWRIQASNRLGIAALTKASEINPESPSLHMMMGNLLQEKGDLAEAAAEFRKAIALKPDFLAAHIDLARSLNSDHKLDEAEQEVKYVLHVSPKDPEANFLMGEILVNRTDLAAALPFLLNAQQASPDELPYVHADLSRIYEERGDVTQAIAELKQALSADADGSYHYRLGHLYLKAGDRAAANAALQTAEKLQRASNSSSRFEK